MTIQDKIRKAIDEANLSAAEVARRMTVTPQAVNGWLTTGRIGKSTLSRLAELTKKELGWFLKDASEIQAQDGRSNIAAAHGMLFDWPLVSWVRAGNRQEALEPYERDDAPVFQFSTRPGETDISLKVRGDSMVRADGSGFPDGCFIAVMTRRRPKSGEFVVVRFPDTNEATFKQFIVDGPIKLLKPLNPAYPTQIFPPDAVIVGTICEKRIIERF